MVDSTGGGLVLFFGGIDRGSPQGEVSFRHLLLASIKMVCRRLRCCRPRRYVERGARKGSLVFSQAFLGFAPPGPLLDAKHAAPQSEWRVGRPRVWGADVGVCRQFGRREYFFFLSPWMGPCYVFL